MEKKFVLLLISSVAISSVRIVEQLMIAYSSAEEKGTICQTTPCNGNFINIFYPMLNSVYYAITIATYLAFFIVYHWKLPKIKKLAAKQQQQQLQQNSNNQIHKQQHQFSETARIYSALVVFCICYSIGMLYNLAASVVQFFNLSPEGFSLASSIYILIISLVNLCYTPLLFIFSAKFRNALKTNINLRCCKCHQQPRHPHLQLTSNNGPEAINSQLSIIQKIRCKPNNPVAPTSNAM